MSRVRAGAYSLLMLAPNMLLLLLPLRGESHLEIIEDPYTVERLMLCEEALVFPSLSLSALIASSNSLMRVSHSSEVSLGSLLFKVMAGVSYLFIGGPALQRVKEFSGMLLIIVLTNFVCVYVYIYTGMDEMC